MSHPSTTRVNYKPSRTDIIKKAVTVQYVVIPPDGGWGWVVMWACFLNNVILGGTLYAVGKYKDAFQEEFHVTEFNATMVGATFTCFHLLAGPFISAICNRYGFRFVTIMGGIVMGFGLFISHYTTSLYMLIFTYGVVGGTGGCMVYVPATIAVSFYFKRWRGLATCVVVCGSSIGTCIIPPILAHAIEHLGWRTAMVIHSVLAFQTIFIGLLLRPITPTAITIHSVAVADEEYPRLTSTASIQSRRDSDPVEFPTLAEAARGSVVTTDDHERDSTSRPKLRFRSNSSHLAAAPVPRRSIGSRPLYRDDIFYGGDVRRLSTTNDQEVETDLKYHMRMTRMSTTNDIDQEVREGWVCCPEAVTRTFAAMLDLNLLKSPSFVIIILTGSLTQMGINVPFYYINQRTLADGTNRQLASMMVAIAGFSSTLARIGCGIACAFPRVNVLVLHNVVATVGGVITVVSFLSTSPYFQVFYTVMLGCAIAAFFSLRAVIIVDTLGLEKLTNAYGLMLLFQGIAAMMGPPLGGYIFQRSGSYDAVFIFSGGLITIAAMIKYNLGWVNRREKRAEEEAATLKVYKEAERKRSSTSNRFNDN